ncbi:MAG: hypothetical protein HC880_19705 [Bacteroidia bacterium]|nr:hypothetical protein [Bacteroidia bacterium]
MGRFLWPRADFLARSKARVLYNLLGKEISVEEASPDFYPQQAGTEGKGSQPLKTQNPQADTSAPKAEIDPLIYPLYGLTEEAMAMVEGG